MPALSAQDVAWSADGSVLLSSGQLSRDTGGGAATLWDVTDRARPVLLPTRGFGDRFISAATMSPDGRTVALTSGQRLVLWDVTDRRNPHALAGSVASYPALIRSVAFSPRGDVLATGSNDQTVAIWRVPDGARLAVLDGHEQAVNTVAFTADATMIAALDDSGVVTFWGVADPTLAVRLHTIPAERGNPATSMVLGHDGRRVFVGRNDGTVEVRDIGWLRDLTADPVRAACGPHRPRAHRVRVGHVRPGTTIPAYVLRSFRVAPAFGLGARPPCFPGRVCKRPRQVYSSLSLALC